MLRKLHAVGEKRQAKKIVFFSQASFKLRNDFSSKNKIFLKFMMKIGFLHVFYTENTGEANVCAV
jgi:hypothetical protein